MSFVSCIQATFTLRLNRSVESSVYPDMMPLALYCKKEGWEVSEETGGTWVGGGGRGAEDEAAG